MTCKRFLLRSLPVLLCLALLMGFVPGYADAGPTANLALGKPVTLTGYGEDLAPDDENFSAAAVERGLAAGLLTDGICDSPNWWVNDAGLFYTGLHGGNITGPYSLTLDLEETADLTELALYAYDRPSWGPTAPENVTFSLSADGESWTEAGSVSREEASIRAVEDPRNPDDPAPDIVRFGLEGEFAGARYVRVSFEQSPSGKTAIGELEAYGPYTGTLTETNLALGRMANTGNYTYVVTGGGTGYDSTGTTHEDGTRYTVSELENASLYRLTDGETVNAGPVRFDTGWEPQLWNEEGSLRSKYVEFYRNISRELTLNLGAVRNITAIDMHFGAVEAYGIYMPTDVRYYLSLDGTDYYEAGVVTVDEAAADPNDANVTVADDGETLAPYHLDFRLEGLDLNARYLKVIFPVSVYLFADELTVTGYEAPGADAKALDTLPLYDPAAGQVNAYASPAQTGGVHNEFMGYQGWYINSDGSEVYNTWKTVDEYMAAIAYVDEEGAPQDWLFDDVTVMGHYYTSGGKFVSYKAGATTGDSYADKADWYEWLCYAFGLGADGQPLDPDYVGGETVVNLNALEAAAGQAKAALNAPDYKVGVKLVIYPTVEFQDHWGELDGQDLDFTIAGVGREAALANRLAAYKWYIDTAVEMWEKADFENLELTGFYYYEEQVHESTDRIAEATLQGLTELVHTRTAPATNTMPAFDSSQGGRLYIYQLPLYQAEGSWKWSDYGFDYALMQPNYAFHDIYTIQQLYECGEFCEKYGLGMQMEFGGTGSRGYIQKFEDYLALGADIGYQNAVLSWYTSTYGCYEASRNVENTRYLYDAIYRFVRGETVDFTQDAQQAAEPGGTYNLALGLEPVFEYEDIIENVVYWTAPEIAGATDLLTDGINDSPNWWVNDSANYYIGIDVNCLAGPYRFIADLGNTYALTAIDGWFYDRPAWEVSKPESVEYFVSADGENWTGVGTVTADQADAVTVEDSRNPEETPPDICRYGLTLDGTDARYVMVSFSSPTGTAPRMGFGEWEIYGSAD